MLDSAVVADLAVKPDEAGNAKIWPEPFAHHTDDRCANFADIIFLHVTKKAWSGYLSRFAA